LTDQDYHLSRGEAFSSKNPRFQIVMQNPQSFPATAFATTVQLFFENLSHLLVRRTNDIAIQGHFKGCANANGYLATIGMEE
jgi:hypothetical protein